MDHNSLQAQDIQSLGSENFSYGIIKILGDGPDALSLQFGGRLEPANDISFNSDSAVNSQTGSTRASVDKETYQMFNVNESHPREAFASNYVSAPGIDQSKEVLERILESFHSERGAFLTKTVFLNNQIYSKNETITNGTVKINIIQEVNDLLKKFLPNSKKEMDLPSTSLVKTTVEYYVKLMDAFDILNKKAPDEDEFVENMLSRVNTSQSSLLRTYSIDSKASIRSSSSTTNSTPKASETNSTHSSPRHSKRSDSILLEKLRFRKKPQKQISSDSLLRKSMSNSQKPRPLSMMSVTSTQTSTSRSVKDQASIQEYFQSLEFLQKTLVEIHDLYMDSNDLEVCNRLDLVIGFQSKYILKFLLQDITTLVMKHMKKSVQNFV